MLSFLYALRKDNYMRFGCKLQSLHASSYCVEVISFYDISIHFIDNLSFKHPNKQSNWLQTSALKQLHPNWIMNTHTKYRRKGKSSKHGHLFNTWATLTNKTRYLTRDRTLLALMLINCRLLSLYIFKTLVEIRPFPAVLSKEKDAIWLVAN